MPEAQALQSWLEQGWYAARPRAILRPLSWLYGLAMDVRGWCYRRGLFASARPAVPTVVIGNLAVGGTGKTPLALWLAGQLQAQGRRPGIMLRGYGGRQRAARLVTAQDDPLQAGDEALLLAQRGAWPVACGARRLEAAQLLVDAGCDVLIADDGLQHLALRRDLSIVVVDGTRGFGNGALLPAGPLREPAGRLADADCVVLHGEDRWRAVPPALQPLRMRLVARSLRQVATGREEPLQCLRGAAVHAVAGIGHPGRFFELLRGLGADPIEHPWPDHHVFRGSELDFGDGRWIVMTEKDAVKCRRLAAGREDLLFLQVEAELPQADAARLLDRVHAIGRA